MEREGERERKERGEGVKEEMKMKNSVLYSIDHFSTL